MLKIQNPSVKKLLTYYQEISLLGKIKSILHWDLNVNLPQKASKGRAEQLAYLEEKYTNLWLDKEFQKTLEKAQSESKNISKEEQAIVRNLTHAMKYYTKIPKALLIEESKLTSEGFLAWRDAREKNAFSIFQPFLERTFQIQIEKAHYLGFQDSPYDALLDMYEPELTVKEVTRLFTPLKRELTFLLKQIQKSKNYTDNHPLIDGKNTYSQESQKALVLSVMQDMGFDFGAGRMDISVHPFTTELDRYDIRITNKYSLSDFRESFTAGMHETGHGLYEQAVDTDFDGTPLESGVSLGIHEAMSRFWENMVGKNPLFLAHMLPTFKKHYPQLGATTEKEIIGLFNMVKPSFIRIEADEVTYALHIILRFEMERDLIQGKIKVQDAPERWRQLSEELFGIVPDVDSQGILQDVHWAYGSIGYFPSYALGNLYGAQCLWRMKQVFGFDKTVGQGNLLAVKKWLDTNIHKYGSLYYPRELIKMATGEDLNPKYFVDYLKEKYTKLYEP